MYFSDHEKKSFSQKRKKIISLLYMMKKREGTFFSSLPKPIINAIFRLTETWEISTKGRMTYFCKDGHCYTTGEEKPVEVFLPEHERIVKVFPAQSSTIFYLGSSGNFYVSGNNSCGELGLGPLADTFQAFPILFTLPNKKQIKKFSLGCQLTFVQDVDGNWFGCGNNINGQLGTGNCGLRYKYNELVPISLPNKHSINKIVASRDHVFMRDDQGRWYGCGYSLNGQLVQYTMCLSVNGPSPIQLPNNKPIKTITVSKSSTYIQDNEGNWYGCGNNYFNQLGFSNKSIISNNHDTPTLITLPNDMAIKNIIARSNHAFIQDVNNNWYGVGSNYNGQLGINKTCSRVDTPTPIQFPNNIIIKKIVAGDNHTFVLGMDNLWYCTGGINVGVHSTQLKNNFIPRKNFFSLIDFSALENMALLSRPQFKF